MKIEDSRYRRLAAALAAAWLLAAVAVAVPWVIYSRFLNPGGFTRALLAVLFLGVLTGLVLALRTFAQARGHALLRSLAALGALVTGVLSLAYLYFAVLALWEAGRF